MKTADERTKEDKTSCLKEGLREEKEGYGAVLTVCIETLLKKLSWIQQDAYMTKK